MGDPFSYLEHFDGLLTSYNEGQKENSENNNVVTVGVPRSGKGQLTGWLKEHGLAGDHIKLFEVHAADTEHLEEIFQFMLPNGYLLNRKAKKMVDNDEEPKGIIQIMEQGRYKDPDTSVSDLRSFLDVCDSERPEKRIEFLDELIEEESNYSLRENLKKVRGKQVEIQNRLDQIRGCYNQNNRQLPNLPDTFQKNYTGKKVQGFNVKVFTPISDSMPTCEVPDFFEPFAVPVDAYKKYDDLEHGLKIIHSEKFKQYKGLYQRAVRTGDTSFQDLRSVDELKGSDYKVKREYGDGKEWEDVRVRNEENIKEKFKRDWNDMFFPIGVVCSSDFDHKLRSRLKEAVLDDDVDIVTLYTGFLGDQATRKFVMVYFIETLFDIVRGLSGNDLRKLDRQFVASMIEAQGVIKQSTRRLKNVDRVFNGIMRKSMNNSGHYNFSFWFDVKPGDAHRLMKSKVPNKIITKVEEDVKDWCSKNLDGKKDLVKQAFSDEMDYGSLDGTYPEFGFGFLYTGTGDVEWEDKHGRKRYGHRLPCPRMCVQDPVDVFSKNDWSFFLDELGFDSMSFEPYMDDLFQEDWQANAGPHIESKKEKKEEEKRKEEHEEKEKRDLLVEAVREKLKSKVNERGEVPSAWTPLAEEILEELHDQGMAEDWEIPRNVMDATQDLRMDLEENFNSGGGDLDTRQLAEEVIRIEEAGIPIFVYTATSKGAKRNEAQDYLMNEYGLEKGAAEEKAEKVVSKAVSKILRPRGVIDGSHRVQEEYEDNSEKFWSEFGREVDESEDSDSSEEDRVEDREDVDQEEDVDDESVDEIDDEDVEEESAESDTDYAVVRVTSDVPEFKGTDLDNYGPFDEGDEVRVPVDNADILTARGKAEFVEDSGNDVEDEDGEEEEPEPPGQEWNCICGTLNEGDRSVCRNPNCLKSYEEVKQEL